MTIWEQELLRTTACSQTTKDYETVVDCMRMARNIKLKSGHNFNEREKLRKFK